VRTPEQLIRDTEPFPDSVVETLKATAKRPALSYVSWPHYNQRLLLHYPDYGWEVSSLVAADGVWAVVGALTIDGVRYAGVGEDSTPTSAESNAYKRACAHAGIGLHLYGGYWLHDRLVKGVGDAA